MLHERLMTVFCSKINATKHRALAQVTVSTLYCDVCHHVYSTWISKMAYKDVVW